VIKKIIFSILWLWSVCAFAGGEWIADAKTGCKVWNSNPEPGESISWSGSCSNGKATGSGTLQWDLNGKPGERYEGEYRDGQFNGQGTFIWANGNRYEGKWRESQFNGQGTFVWANGSRFEGEWRDGKKRGFGIQRFVRDDEAIPQWKEVGKGQWVKEKFVLQGFWEDDGKLVQECSSKAACEQQQKAEYARQEREKRELANRPFREGDNVCIMQWQGTGFCGNVDRVSGDRLKVEITRITCGGWVGVCNADPCSGGVSVGPSGQAKVKDFVWTEKYCVTSR
jgi:hypothetical protein